MDDEWKVCDERMWWQIIFIVYAQCNRFFKKKKGEWNIA